MNKDYFELRGKLYYSARGKLVVDTGRKVIEINDDLIGDLHGEEVKIIIQRLPERGREE